MNGNRENVYGYEVKIRGRIRASTRRDAEQRLREMITMSVEVHDSLDDLTIQTVGESFDDLGERFRG